MHRILEPESFWQKYSSELNRSRNWDAYKNDTTWTTEVIRIAEETCKKFGLKTQKEYYKIDLIGYRREEPNVDRNWWLDVAYEHENRNDWDSELCKLCYVAADLRVISSYYKLYNAKGEAEEPIEKKLKSHLERLGKEKILRVPSSKWLFVFGPRWVCAKQPFKAFTIDEKLTVIPIIGGEEVVPQR
jgi:hypothetical protein